MWQSHCTSNSGLWVHQGAFISMFTMKAVNTCCIAPTVYPISVRRGLFVGVMCEHQHLVSLINFKTVWQPHCISNFSLLVHLGVFTCCFISKVYPTSVRRGLLTGVMSEQKHCVSLLILKQCGSHSVLAILVYGLISGSSACTLCKH